MKARTVRSPLVKEEAGTAAGHRNGAERVRATLLRIDETLRAAYRTPDLGNKVDPLDEILFLLITQRTRIDLARRVYADFRREFHPWRKVLRPENRARLKRALNRGGRGNLRYRAVTQMLTAVRKRVGGMSLEFLRGEPRAEAEEFLLSLPGVGRKTAYCVLMYSLRHPVFPVDSNIIRIFRRAAILAPAGVALNGVDHRTAQRKIAPVIPEEIAYSLHVNMVMHGREVCLERNPRCDVCPIRLHCGLYRAAKRKEAGGFRYTMVDLFSGAGGISYGFARAGIRPVLAVDSRQAACDTHTLNIPWLDGPRVMCRDITSIKDNEIRQLIDNERVDILVAGVPCQGFSRVGLTSKPSLKKQRPPEKEAINRLFMEVIRWTGILKPSVVLLENVPDMGNSKILFEDSSVRVKEVLGQRFTKLGYSSATVHLNSADFGLPQVRWRLFFIASRHGKLSADLKGELLGSCGRDTDGGKPERVPLSVALTGLPPLSPSAGSEIAPTPKDYPGPRRPGSAYGNLVYDNPYVVFNHIARPHNEDDLRIISSLKPGETYRQLLLRKPEVIVGRKRKVYSVESFHDKFYRLDPTRPGRTIVSHLAKDGNSFIHPFQDRAITVREAARIQGFPDSFAFQGSRTAQFVQLGNAVPPLVAWRIAEFVKQHLLGGEDG